MKQRSMAVVKYLAQPEVLKLLRRVGAILMGSVLIYCVANWQTYTHLAQLLPGHPALGKYESGVQAVT
jgi:hypothetical protein